MTITKSQMISIIGRDDVTSAQYCIHLLHSLQKSITSPFRFLEKPSTRRSWIESGFSWSVVSFFFPNLDKFGIIAKVSSSIFIVFLHVGMREWPGSLYEQNKFILPCKTFSSQVKTSTRNSKTLNREQLSWRNATTFMQFIQWSWLPMRVKHEAYLPG